MIFFLSITSSQVSEFYVSQLSLALIVIGWRITLFMTLNLCLWFIFFGSKQPYHFFLWILGECVGTFSLPFMIQKHIPTLHLTHGAQHHFSDIDGRYIFDPRTQSLQHNQTIWFYISLLELPYKVSQTEFLIQQTFYCLTNPGGWVQDHGVGRFDFYWGGMFHTSLLASHLLAVFDLPWLGDASSWSLLSHYHGILPVCMSLYPKFPFL